VVETAADLWAALPAPPAPAAGPDPGAGRSEVMAQLSVMIGGIMWLIALFTGRR